MSVPSGKPASFIYIGNYNHGLVELTDRVAVLAVPASALRKLTVG